jgi:hypothetical protein
MKEPKSLIIEIRDGRIGLMILITDETVILHCVCI